MSTLPPFPAPASRDRPLWLGLEPYTEADSDRFLGRHAEISDLRRRVENTLLTTLFAQSGIGKTSLLRAGLFPALRRVGLHPVYVRLDHSENAPDLVQQVFDALAPLLPADTAPPSAPTLWEWFHQIQNGLLAPAFAGLTPVLVFDQFEEIFTLGLRHESRLAPREAFLVQLADLAENRMPEDFERRLETGAADPDQFDPEPTRYRLLLTLREDYLSFLDREKSLIPSLMKNRMPIDRLSGLKALDVVTGPAPDLVSAPVAEQIVRFVAGAEASQPLADFNIEPPLLSLVCQRLDAARGDGPITSELLKGNREGILQSYYDECFTPFPPSVRAFIEDELVTDSGFRTTLATEEAEREIGPEAIRHLVEVKRFLHAERRGQLQQLELTHDILARLVVQSRGERRAREAEAERAATQSSLASRRRRRLLSVGLAAAFVLISGLATWATFNARAASRAEALTRAEAARAASEAGYFYTREALRAAALLPESEGDATRPLLAQAYLSEGLRRGAEFEPARLALLRRLLPEPGLRLERRFVLPSGLQAVSVASSPDGRWQAALLSDHRLALWPLAASRASEFRFLRIAPASSPDSPPAWSAGFDAPSPSIRAFAFDHDQTLVVSLANRDLLAFSLAPEGPRLLARTRLPADYGSVRAVTFDPTGSRFLLGADHGLVLAWQPAADAAPPAPLFQSLPASSPRAQLDPSGQFILSFPASESSPRLLVHALTPPHALHSVPLNHPGFPDLIPSPEGAVFIQEYDGKNLITRRLTLPTPTSSLASVAFDQSTKLSQSFFSSQNTVAFTDSVSFEGVLESSLSGHENLFIDAHQIELPAGARVTIDLRSSQFDTVLRVTPPSGGEPWENDDHDSSAGTDSRVVFETQTPGLYRIGVRAFSTLQSGPYRVEVTYEFSSAASPVALALSETELITALPNGELLLLEPSRQAGTLEAIKADRASFSFEPDITPANHPLLALATSPASRRLAALYANGEVVVFSFLPTPETGPRRVETRRLRTESLPRRLRFSPDGTRLFLGSQNSWFTDSLDLSPSPDPSFPAASGRAVLDLAVLPHRGLLLLTTAEGIESWSLQAIPSRLHFQPLVPAGPHALAVADDESHLTLARRDPASPQLTYTRFAWSPTAPLDSLPLYAFPHALRAPEVSLPAELGRLVLSPRGDLNHFPPDSDTASETLPALAGEVASNLSLRASALSPDGRSVLLSTSRGDLARVSLPLPIPSPVARELLSLGVADYPVSGELTLVHPEAIERLLAHASLTSGSRQTAPGPFVAHLPPYLVWRASPDQLAVTTENLQLVRSLPAAESDRLLALSSDASVAFLQTSLGPRLLRGEQTTSLDTLPALDWTEAGFFPDQRLWLLARPSNPTSPATTPNLLLLDPRGNTLFTAKHVTAVGPEPASGHLWFLSESLLDDVETPQVTLSRLALGTSQARLLGTLSLPGHRLAVLSEARLIAVWGGAHADRLTLWTHDDDVLLPFAVGSLGQAQAAARPFWAANGDWFILTPEGHVRAYTLRPESDPALIHAQGGFLLDRISLKPIPLAEHQRLLAAVPVYPTNPDRAAYLMVRRAFDLARRGPVPSVFSPEQHIKSLIAPLQAYLDTHPGAPSDIRDEIAGWLASGTLPALTADTPFASWLSQLRRWDPLSERLAEPSLEAAVLDPASPAALRRQAASALLPLLQSRLENAPARFFSLGPQTDTLSATLAKDLTTLLACLDAIAPWSQRFSLPSPHFDQPDLSAVANLLPTLRDDQTWLGRSRLQLLEIHARLTPGNGDTWNDLGLAYETSRPSRLDEALLAYQLASAAASPSPFGIGNYVGLTQNTDPDLAWAFLSRQPEEVFNAYTFRRQGELLDHLRRFQEAESAWRRALTLESDHAYSQRRLATNLVRQDRIEDAVAYLTPFLTAATSADQLSTYLEFFWNHAPRHTLYEFGLEATQTALVRFGPHPELLRHQGRLRLHLADYLGALADWQESLRLGEASDAHSGDNTWRKAWIEAEIGELFLRSHRPEEALPWFDRALQSYPREHWALWRRALALGQLKRYDLALQTVRRAFAIQSDPDYTLTESRLLWQRNQANDRASARQRLDLHTVPDVAIQVQRAILALVLSPHPAEATALAQAALALPNADLAYPREHVLALALTGQFEHAFTRLHSLREAWPVAPTYLHTGAVVEAFAASRHHPGTSLDRAFFVLTQAVLRGYPATDLASDPWLQSSGLAAHPAFPALLASADFSDPASPDRFLALARLLASLPDSVNPASLPPPLHLERALAFAFEQAHPADFPDWPALARQPENVPLFAHPAAAAWLASTPTLTLAQTQRAAILAALARDDFAPDLAAPLRTALQSSDRNPTWSRTYLPPASSRYFDDILVRLTLRLPSPNREITADFTLSREGHAVRLLDVRAQRVPDFQLTGQHTAGQGSEHVRYPLIVTEACLLTLDLKSSSFDTLLRVTTPDGRVKENDDAHDTTTNSRLSFVTTPGIHYLTVSAFELATAGPYSLDVWFEAPPLTSPARVTGELSASSSQRDQHAYATHTFLAKRDEILAIELRSSDFDPLLRLTGPDGKKQENDDGFPSGTDSRLFLVASAPGLHEIEVTSFAQNSFGTYELTLASFLPAATDSLSGRLSAQSPRINEKATETHRITLAPGDFLIADLKSSAFDPYLRILAPDGTEWTNDDYQGSVNHSRLEVVAPVDGQYQIQVTSYESGESGDYTLQLIRAQPTP